MKKRTDNLFWSLIAASIAIMAVLVFAGMGSHASYGKSLIVISTSNGVYVGHVYKKFFSHFVKVKNPYVYSEGRDENGGLVWDVTPLSSQSLWNPREIYINKEQIIFKGTVSVCSLVDIRINQRTESDCPAAFAKPNSPTKE